MKRMLNHKKRPSVKKKSLNSHKRYFRTIKSSKKSIQKIESPRNTSEYLIKNSSSPFFDDDEDFEPDYITNPLLSMKETENWHDENALDIRKISSLSTQAESFPFEDQHLDLEQPYLF